MKRAAAGLAALALLVGCEDVRAIVPDGSANAPDGGSTEWTRVAPPDGGAPDADFLAVSGSAADDVIFVGTGGTIVRWQGPMKGMRREASGTTADLHAVVAISPTAAFAVGAGGTILRWDGMTWSPEMYPLPDGGVDPDGGYVPATPKFLTGVAASDAMNAVAVGQNGLVATRSPAGWTTATVGQDDLLAASSNGSVYYAVGALGAIFYGTGGVFTRQPIPAFNKTLSGVGNGPTGWFYVGVEGAAYTATQAGSYNKVDGMPPVFLRGVANPKSDVFVVGFDGTIVRVRGQTVFAYPNIANHWLYGVWGAADDDVWIAGTSGLILHGPPPVDPVPDGGA